MLMVLSKFIDMEIQLNIEQLKHPNQSSIYRATNYFDFIFNGLLDDSNVWIAGGCWRAYFQQSEKIQDIDIFTTDRKECASLVWKLRKIGFKPYFKNKNAIKGIIIKKGKRIEVDIVKRFYENEIECIKDFDFTVAKFAYNMKSKNVFYTENYFADLITKRLVISDLEFGNPIGSLKRLQKYTNKGYTACNGTLLSIAKRISETDLNNPENNDIEFYPDGRAKIFLFD